MKGSWSAHEKKKKKEPCTRPAGWLNCTIPWKRDLLHEFSSDFSFIVWFTVNETTPSENSLPKRKRADLRRGRRPLCRGHTWASTPVSLSELKECSQAAGPDSHPRPLTSESEVKRKVSVDATELNGCKAVDWEFTPHGFAAPFPDLCVL